MIDRRRFAGAALAGLASARALAGSSAGAKVLRLAFDTAESSFDPVPLGDAYSQSLVGAIFEAPLAYDYLARPYRLKPLTAVALPEASSDFRTWTLRIRPGIHFADDAAFKGRRRELVAQDYVYSLKRHFDPKLHSGMLFAIEGARIAGLDALRAGALAGKPFDYDAPVEGLRALDRYTLQIRLEHPAPRFAHEALAFSGAFGAVAREVVEHYGEAIGEHPVGTGAFRLAEWRRSSRIVLERNPDYREERYAEQPQPGDVAGEAIAARLAGRRLPLVDRVEVAIVEEAQPRWLAFLQGDLDMLELPADFAAQAVVHGELAPYLRRRGIGMDRIAGQSLSVMALFNLRDPVVGGYAPAQVALRRAVGLAWDLDAASRLLGERLPAATPVAPLTFGYEARASSEMSTFDPVKANALLDLYGYADRDGDGWRERPDGRPLRLEWASQSDSRSRAIAELWGRCLKRIGVRVVFRLAQWPENLKALRAGKLMVWNVGLQLFTPDSDLFFSIGYGPNADTINDAHFQLPEFDRLYRLQAVLPDGSERAAALRRASALLTAYMPYKLGGFLIETDLMQPWLVGWRRHLFTNGWRFVDIDAHAAAHG